jgi:RNA polymerase sigma factor for flagellar operon FliA
MLKEHKEDLVRQYLPTIKRIAYSLLRKLPNTIQFDDLVQAGSIGLLESLDRYDPNNEASFGTFAGIRIHGAMLDEVRHSSWIPKNLYARQKYVTSVYDSLESTLFRKPSLPELAEALNMTVAELNAESTALGLEIVYGNSVDYQYVDNQDPVEEQQFYTDLAKSVLDLPDRYLMLMRLYYSADKNMKEIGAALNVSESRICIMHRTAIKMVQSSMHNWI